MNELYKLILNNLNSYIVLKNKQDQIIYINNDFAINLSNLNKLKNSKISYDNNIYSVDYTNFLEYNMEIYNNVTFYENEIEKLKKDYLTKIYNRHYIFEKIEELKNQNMPFSIVMSDIDFFKSINDNYGHLVGDYVLKGVSDILSNNINQNGIVGRYGGEEFIIVIPNDIKEEVYDIIEKIRIQIEKTKIKVKYNDCIKEFYITMTFGFSIYNENDTIEQIISRADQALYKGKNNGRNQINYM